MSGLDGLRGCSNAREVEACLRGVELRDLSSYTRAMTAWGRVKQWGKALELLSACRAAGWKPDQRCYMAAVTACSKCGQWTHAVRLVSEMGDDGIRADVITYSSAIGACEKTGQWRPAVELFEGLCAQGLRPDAQVYNILISCLVKGGKPELALEQYDRLRAANLPLSVYTLGVAIPACGALGQWERCLSLLAEARTSGVEPNQDCARRPAGRAARRGARAIPDEARGAQEGVTARHAAVQGRRRLRRRARRPQRRRPSAWGDAVGGAVGVLASDPGLRAADGPPNLENC